MGLDSPCDLHIWSDVAGLSFTPGSVSWEAEKEAFVNKHPSEGLAGPLPLRITTSSVSRLGLTPWSPMGSGGGRGADEAKELLISGCP